MIGVRGFCFLPGCLLMFICFVHPIKITEKNLRGLLTKEEWLHIMGSSDSVPAYSVVYPSHLPHLPNRRHRRSATSEDRLLEVDAPALKRRFILQLTPSPQLTTKDFKFVATWSNRSEDLPLEMAAKEGCYYRGERSALSLCGGIRGIVSSTNNEYFIINPLPQRLQEDDSQPHVIIHRPVFNTFSTQELTPITSLTPITPLLPITPTNPICAHDELTQYTSKKYWTKHRRKKEQNKLPEEDIKRNKYIKEYDDYKEKEKKHVNVKDMFYNKTKQFKEEKKRKKRALLALGSPVFVETAVFVDRDLFQHMRANYPSDTERELVRFVLAMINAVQLLYHDPSLGRPVNFVLKRLEILHEEPAGLARPHDIDRFLSSFCSWQRLRNPPGDQDPQHWDHALILTGLDLYVVGKRGKVSSQVVGLAPVAGMCTMTSSCTVNEGRHFESVYVVAHEIGHNLGMRHDGPLADNDCDPSSYIMSPTLGSGKITWSPCSRRYLQKFLETSQSRCLLDHGSSAGQLDHSAEGALPGERFDADQQCMLKYGQGSKHSLQQPLDDVCRDLHCQRERYTWTSHPALEGTTCGHQQWCRGGRCLARGVQASYTSSGSSSTRSGAVIAAPGSGGLSGSVDGGWSEWRPYTDCASGCLYGEEGRLRAGSTGIMTSTRRCNRPRPEGNGRPCQGPDRRHQACSASQCINVPRMTLREFAVQICERAKEVDTDLTGAGLQRISSDPEEACMVWCLKRNGDTKNRGWTFPDGTVCQTRRIRFGRQSHCINGRCEDFDCPQSSTTDLSFLQNPDLCPVEEGDNELAWRGGSKQRRRDTTTWVPASGCHFNCMSPGSGVRLVVSKSDKRKSSIQLCQPDKLGCGRIKSPFQHATTVCSKYKERVRRLSGLGMQISAAVEDPDRPCRIACQDENVSHRFYLVNGEDGWFPFGTDCSRGSADKRAFCISGKCLEFGPDETPLSENEFTLPLLSRSKRSLESNKTRVIATLQQQDLDQLISRLNLTLSGPINAGNIGQSQTDPEPVDIDLTNPIFVEMNMPPYAMQPYRYYRGNDVNFV